MVHFSWTKSQIKDDAKKNPPFIPCRESVCSINYSSSHCPKRKSKRNLFCLRVRFPSLPWDRSETFPLQRRKVRRPTLPGSPPLLGRARKGISPGRDNLVYRDIRYIVQFSGRAVASDSWGRWFKSHWCLFYTSSHKIGAKKYIEANNFHSPVEFIVANYSISLPMWFS